MYRYAFFLTISAVDYSFSFKELSDDPDVDFPKNEQPRHGHLICWAKQGVLLLNAVLTVRDGQPNSHQNQGWEKVTDEIIRLVVLHQCSSLPSKVSACDDQAPRGCVFLLWGKPATAKAMNVIESTIRDVNRSNDQTTKTHVVITTSHPSPLGARKTAAPFLGSRCFSRCNKALTEMGHNPVDWNVD
jgi:uracil DNA glycosylase